jgi:L-ectoine synthase
VFVRKIDNIKAVEWGNGISYRFLVQADQMGFTLCHTVVHAGTRSKLEYRRHLEACYCIAGSGWISTADDNATYELHPGVLYALNKHDAHFLIAAPESDLELISVFNPPLHGDERHNLDSGEFSQY